MLIREKRSVLVMFVLIVLLCDFIFPAVSLGFGGKRKKTVAEIENEATDIVLGFVMGIKYDEYVDPAKNRGRVRYTMRIVPFRVLRGGIEPYEGGDNAQAVAITVEYHHPGTVFGGGRPKVLVRPQQILPSLLFLNHKEDDLYKLSNPRMGILPMYPDVLGGNETDIWAMIMTTLEDVRIPRYIHDRIVKYFMRSKLSAEKKEELNQIDTQYYKKLSASIEQKLQQDE